MEGVLASFEMAGPARQAVHALKYRFVRALAPAMAPHLVCASSGHSFNAVFPVPLHRSREKSRGFNQAELLVQAAGWDAEPGLTRVRNTGRQVGMHERQRRANVAGAFRYAGRDLAGLRVALVDDVITTGATMQECAVLLRAAGAREVWGVAFARASYRVALPDAPIED
ncbi:MAG: ComF family protein [Anaerolinea sp.]|nr:ComF family protein [Anaerolinea sp.]